MNDVKALSHLEIKNADRGEVEAVFSRFGVVDKDGDVTLPGAFTDGAEVPISAYGHRSHAGALPVGKGAIRQTSDEAILDGKFFLDTVGGRDTFTVIKELGSLGQWSYGYAPVKHSFGEHSGRRVRFLEQLKVLEVSPVLEGSGINTRTIAAKGADPEGNVMPTTQYKAAIRPHETDVVNRTWDRNAVVSAVPDDASVSDLRSMAAWVDPSIDPDTKGAYGFWHHHGVDGPANVRACVNGIAILNGARGGTGPWSSDKKGIYDHLAGHIRDADREPPDLKADGGSIKPNLWEEVAAALAGVSAVSDSASRVVALRAARGKQLSKTNTEILDWLDEDLMALHRKMRSYIDNPDDEAVREFMRYVQATNGGQLP